MIEFGHPAALWTGLAIGFPILAHMAYRRITERYSFSSIRFIVPSQIPRSGRRTPTDKLLLLLRILLFAAITILLADPFWINPTKPNEPQESPEVVLAIDLSPSMGGWDGLVEAKEIASRILDESSDKFGLLTFGDGSSQEWHIGTEVSELKKEIANLKHGWRRGNAQTIIERIRSLFSANASRKQLIVVSDMQKGDWQNVDFSSLVGNLEVEFYQVGVPDDSEGRGDNRSLVETKVVPAGPGKVRVWTIARNWSGRKREEQLELVVGGEVEASQTVVLPPSGSSQVQFILPTSEISQATIRFSEPDSLPLDDQRTVWLKAPPPKLFGFWCNSVEDESTKMERNFLKVAVESAGDNGWNRWEESTENADGVRLGQNEQKLELLLIIGMGAWFETEKLGENLSTFLDSGGIAIMTPGEIFGETASILRDSSWFDFSFVRVAGGASFNRNPFRIASLGDGSRLSSLFSGNASRDLYLTSIRKFGILKDLDESIEVPIRDREGRPLALLREYESEGRLIFFPFRMNNFWSDLPLRTSFLPLLMELVRREDSRDQTWPVLEPGSSLVDSDETFIAEKPGVYRFGGKWLEVVFPPAESVVETLEKNDFPDLSGDSLSANTITSRDLNNESHDRESLWLWFAILVAILLTGEMLYSRPKSLMQGNQIYS